MTDELANDLNIVDRMGIIHSKGAYILFKEYNSNFSINTQSRLIIPTKSVLGIILKHIIK